MVCIPSPTSVSYHFPSFFFLCLSLSRSITSFFLLLYCILPLLRNVYQVESNFPPIRTLSICMMRSKIDFITGNCCCDRVFLFSLYRKFKKMSLKNNRDFLRLLIRSGFDPMNKPSSFKMKSEIFVFCICIMFNLQSFQSSNSTYSYDVIERSEISMVI